MLDFDKTKKKVKELYHFIWFMKGYMQLLCDDLCTEEEERTFVVINHIAKLSDDLYYDFIMANSEET